MPGSSVTVTEYSKAIEKLQQNAGLNVTGALNAETIALLETPRCGVFEAEASQLYDFQSDNKRRKKRYYLQGTYWRKKVNSCV